MAERRYQIHPAIGVARVGNAVRSDASNDFYFIGPEFPDIAANVDPLSGAQGTFKTASDGRVKPQAARFRIFEFEKQADGKFHPLGEVKITDASRSIAINWTVHLANRKASFCRFLGQAGAEDTPLYFSSYNNTTALRARNFGVKGLSDRAKFLELDPGPRSIAGGAVTVQHFAIDHDLKQAKPNGQTKLKITTLGEIRSDNEGHLIVIGGMGQSDFDPGLGSETLTTFANNDGWFDDMSDGPVTANLTIDGVNQPVAGAWVLVGPPDFAPAIRSYRSMYDTLVDVIVRNEDPPADDGLFAGPLAHIAAMRADWKQNGTIKDFRPSFTRDIAPIIIAICRMDRVHQYQLGTDQDPGGGPAARYHGTFSVLNFGNLGGQGSLQATRRALFSRLRDPNTFDILPRPKLDPTRMPAAYGDYYGSANGRGGGPDDPAFLHSLTKLQYALMSAWNSGNFIEDWGQVQQGAPTITPEGLDHASLDNISGGAFFPGMEASWLLSKKEVWERPFRLALGRTVGTVPAPGESSRRDLVIKAGAFSQQMALPWQADFRDCAAGPVDDASVVGKTRRVAWWPTNRPDEVFPTSTPSVRTPWARDASGNPFPIEDAAGFKAMVDNWWTLGFVIDTTPAGAPRDLYEVEFNVAPPLVAAAERTIPDIVV